MEETGERAEDFEDRSDPIWRTERERRLGVRNENRISGTWGTISYVVGRPRRNGHRDYGRENVGRNNGQKLPEQLKILNAQVQESLWAPSSINRKTPGIVKRLIPRHKEKNLQSTQRKNGRSQIEEQQFAWQWTSHQGQGTAEDSKPVFVEYWKKSTTTANAPRMKRETDSSPRKIDKWQRNVWKKMLHI